MKLRFTVNYRAEWGQQLIVCISYQRADGQRNTARLPMQTQDGHNWSAETSVVESRRSHIQSFTYYYIVADSEGRELRREWTSVPRIYACDPTKTYIMPDHWRDVPLNSHLYSQARAVTSGLPIDEQAQPLLQPLFRRTIIFRVSAPQLERGQRLALIGSHPALGQWNPARYLPMSYVGQHDWTVSVNADGLQLPLEYKYVVTDETTHQLTDWEEGDNRLLTNGIEAGQPSDSHTAEGEVLVLYGQPLRLTEPAWRCAGVATTPDILPTTQLQPLIDWAALVGMKTVLLPCDIPLDEQLQSVADYARSKGIFLMTTLPYDADADKLTQKLRELEHYFDALRLDHVVSYFRTWKIPPQQQSATMGHFSPALPLSPEEMEAFGLTFNTEEMATPYISETLVEQVFGIHAEHVCQNYLTEDGHGLFLLRDEVGTQQQVMQLFEGQTDVNSLWIRDGLLRLIANVLFIEDENTPDTYHPRIGGWREPAFRALDSQQRDAYMQLYNHYFFRRHDALWAENGHRQLSQLLRHTHALICADSPGQLPRCVPPVLSQLHIPITQPQHLRHLYSPAMLCILPLSEWLQADSTAQTTPAIDQLPQAQRLNSMLQNIIARSKR